MTDFPSDPTIGQIWPETGTRQWIYSAGGIWRIVSVEQVPDNFSVVTSEEGTAPATSSTGTVGANNSITWTAVTPGTEGNDLSRRILTPETETLAVTVGTSGLVAVIAGLWNRVLVTLDETGPTPTYNNDVEIAYSGPVVLIRAGTVAGKPAWSESGTQTSTGQLYLYNTGDVWYLSRDEGFGEYQAIYTGDTPFPTGGLADNIEGAGDFGLSPLAPTAAAVIAAVNASPEASALVIASATPPSNSTGAVVAAAQASFTGGLTGRREVIYHYAPDESIELATAEQLEDAIAGIDIPEGAPAIIDFSTDAEKTGFTGVLSAGQVVRITGEGNRIEQYLGGTISSQFNWAVLRNTVDLRVAVTSGTGKFVNINSTTVADSATPTAVGWADPQSVLMGVPSGSVVITLGTMTSRTTQTQLHTISGGSTISLTTSSQRHALPFAFPARGIVTMNISYPSGSE